MASVADIVGRALRLLRVVDANEAVEASDFATAVLALNQMVRRWEADGIALGWLDVANPADTLPAPPETEEALAYNLAVRLRPEYGASLDGDVVGIAKYSLSCLLRDRLVSMPLVGRSLLDRSTWYDIYTDSYI